MATISRDDVRAALRSDQVVERYGLRLRGSATCRGTCTFCASASREPFCLDAGSGRWICHACNASGDLLALVAGLEGLDIRQDFRRVLAIAADACGVSVAGVDVEVLRRKAAAYRAEQAEQARLDTERRAKAEEGAPYFWRGLSTRVMAGFRYLVHRGLAHAADEVRYTDATICLPLWRWGKIVNVVRRRIDDAEPKVIGIRNCGTDATFGDVGRVDNTTGPVVIVEGLTDWLAARCLSPERLVIGAHGAGRLGYAAKVAAPIARERGAIIVPDNDAAGFRAANTAIDVLLAAGVAPTAIKIMDVRPADDLAHWMLIRQPQRTRGAA